jgi:hypothetical protein
MLAALTIRADFCLDGFHRDGHWQARVPGRDVALNIPGLAGKAQTTLIGVALVGGGNGSGRHDCVYAPQEKLGVKTELWRNNKK